MVMADNPCWKLNQASRERAVGSITGLMLSRMHIFLRSRARCIVGRRILVHSLSIFLFVKLSQPIPESGSSNADLGT